MFDCDLQHVLKISLGHVLRREFGCLRFRSVTSASSSDESKPGPLLSCIAATGTYDGNLQLHIISMLELIAILEPLRSDDNVFVWIGPPFGKWIHRSA